jgi:hypothetical protein
MARKYQLISGEYNSWFQLELLLPSEYMKSHGLYGMVREPLAVKVGRFPDSRTYMEETFGDLDAELGHRILVGNAAEHLRLDLDADITETPATG